MARPKLRRWTVLEQMSFDRHWQLTYHRGEQERQGDLFFPSIYATQIFHTRERAEASADLWVKKGRNLPSEKLNELTKSWE